MALEDLAPIPSNIYADEELLSSHLKSLSTTEVCELVEAGHLAVERIADPVLRAVASQDYQQRKLTELHESIAYLLAVAEQEEAQEAEEDNGE